MIEELTRLTLTLAVLLFAMSLPLRDSDAARALRKAAGFTFVLAFVPAILFTLCGPLFRGPHSATMSAVYLFAAIGLGAVFLVLSLAAYGFLNVRERGSRQPRAHADRGYQKERHAPYHGGDEVHHADDDHRGDEER